MKRLITASLLFILICSLSLFENFYIERQFNQTTQSLSQIKTDYLTGEKIKKSRFDELNQKWNKHKNLLTAFINREQIINISTEISLLELKYENDIDEFIISIENIMIMLDEIKNYEKLNTYGLL